jgi:hypothetical protein
MQNNWWPPGLYHFIYEVAFKHQLGVKEVERIFLLRQAQSLGFECFHENVGNSKTDGKPYCKLCWTRLEEIRPAKWRIDAKDKRKKELVQAGLYKPLKTFLDIEEEEKAKQQQQQAPPPPSPPSGEA